MRGYERVLDPIHLSACWSSLGQLVKQSANKCWLRDNAEVVEPLAKHTMQAVNARKMHARGLANIAYAAAGSSIGKQMGALFMAFAT